jgi:dGTPase
MLLRELNEEREHRELASFALKSSESRGRVHPEDEDRFRTVYLRDRDRITHSAAFRRLEYKTQVFIHNEGDYYRTRLTHTLEVAQVARSVAYTLRFNEGFVEALALAHDLGHAPFGHTGEGVLDSLMTGHGGFEHNRQALRTVDTIEKKYPDFNGLNLSYEMREAILKYGAGSENVACESFDPDLHPFLETQIVNLADQIAYQHHDLDDGIKAGILKESDLMDVDLWRESSENVMRRHPQLRGRIRDLTTVNTVVKILIGDLISATERELAPCAGRDAAAMRSLPDGPGVTFSPEMASRMRELQDFLNANFYGHRRLARVRAQSETALRKLFEVYMDDTTMLPPDFRDLAAADGLERAVCDYIAGMTDRFALDEWARFRT